MIIFLQPGQVLDLDISDIFDYPNNQCRRNCYLQIDLWDHYDISVEDVPGP